MSSTHDKLEPVRRLARALPGGMALGRRLRRLFNPELRTNHQLIRTERGRLFQPFPDTWDERYPTLFDALAERLAGLPEPRILSFGCSSEAEVRALRSRLPQARITGIATLDACLVPGGWLANHHSHFRFADTCLAGRYRAEPADLTRNCANRRVAGAELLPILFRKLAEPDPAPGSAT